MTSIEIWGGLECTINRVGDTYFDQLEFSGHYLREKDIELFAELGIKALRYPILWERHAPKKGEYINWTVTENNLIRLRDLGIKIIAGLVHHGSGPAHTNFLDNTFVDGLEEFAGAVAEKFPWIEYYTPVNEPLTTARFCGLYGFWHPHEKSDIMFSNILLSECKATVQAMNAIRKINPNAKLVQTEDIAKTYSTPTLKYQADFENERRWLSYDLLCGKLQPGYRMWDHLRWLGISEDTLNFFVEHPCPPDILGVNYYITSERFIDENIEKYPPVTHGGNGQHAYADVEAARVALIEQTGPELLIKELWDRFKIPIAITEIQLSATREQQLRWVKEMVDCALKLKEDGVNILAVTSWSLLGAFGWVHLLTTQPKDYETGVFDVRGSVPRPTAIAKMIKSFASGNSYVHPVIEEKGWWKKEKRLLYFPFQKKIDNPPLSNESDALISTRPILIIGKRGTLGQAFARICFERDIAYRLLSRDDMDICNLQSIENMLLEANPWAIINAAGYVHVDDAESNSEKCFLDNMAGPSTLAIVCNKYGIRLLTFSTDQVFDGKKCNPYLESDLTSPLNIYGYSKAKAEKNIMNFNGDALVVRTSAFFGPWDQYNFITLTLSSLSKSEVVAAANNTYISPTYIPDLVNTSLDLLIDEEKGIWHISNNGQVTWSDLAVYAADLAGLDKQLVHPVPVEELNLKAKRPGYSVLQSEKGIVLPSFESALERFFASGPVF